MGENRGGKKGKLARELGVGGVTERNRKVGLKRQRCTEHTQVDKTWGERNAGKERRTGKRETTWGGTRTEQRLRQKARLDIGKGEREEGRRDRKIDKIGVIKVSRDGDNDKQMKKKTEAERERQRQRKKAMESLTADPSPPSHSPILCELTGNTNSLCDSVSPPIKGEEAISLVL